tara:strand:- start:1561 stop:2136 length:576 start_codon:yes stop_codon:yes gene_type:complete
MKFRNVLFSIFFVCCFNNEILKADKVDLDNKFIPLKDFILLKFDLFLKNNIKNLMQGGGITGIAYQNVDYEVKFNQKNMVEISMRGVMNKKRYTSKKYIPKLSDCNQMRNKIFVNKYGYSFFNRSLNNMVNEEVLSNIVNKRILNISILDQNLKKDLLNSTKIKIEVVHPKTEYSLNCSGKLINTELKAFE